MFWAIGIICAFVVLTTGRIIWEKRTGKPESTGPVDPELWQSIK